MPISATATEIIITGPEPLISSMLIDDELINFNLYNGGLTDIITDEDYVLSLSGFASEDDAFDGVSSMTWTNRAANTSTWADRERRISNTIEAE